MECSLILPAPVVVLNLAFFTVGVPVTVAPIIVWQRRGLLRQMPTSSEGGAHTRQVAGLTSQAVDGTSELPFSLGV